MSGLSREARTLLASARGSHDAAPGAKDRVRAGLAGAVGGAALGGGVEALELTGGRSGALGWWTGTKIFAGIGALSVGSALLLGQLGQLGARLHPASPDGASAPAVVVAATPSPVAAPPIVAAKPPLAPPITEIRSPEDLPRAPVAEVRSPEDLPRAPAPAPVSVSVSAHAPQDSLSAEVALLRRITASLRAKDARGALRIVGEHARRFPNGALAEEREVERIVALCTLGRSGEATRATERFDRTYPSSSHQARILAACSAPSASP